MAKKLFIKPPLLLFVVGIVLLYMLSVINNTGYATFLKVRNGVNVYMTGKEISSIEKKLVITYKEIGQKISTEDISQEQIKKEINDLVDLSRQYLSQVDNRKKRIVVYKKKLTKEIYFENILKNLFSTEVPTRLEALRTLSKTDLKKSLPYLGLMLVDPEPSVRQEAGVIINQITGSSSEEIKKHIPNLEYLNENN